MSHDHAESMSVSLTETMKAFVQQEVASGQFASASDYVVALIQAAQREKEERELEAALLHGISSGSPIPITPEYWERKRRELFGGPDQAPEA